MSTPNPSAPRPPAPSSLYARLDEPWVRHGLAFALAIVVPTLLRVVTTVSSPGKGLFAFLILVSGFGLLLTGVALYAWWTYVQWVHRDAEAWYHWRLGRGPTRFTRHPSWLAVTLFVVGQWLIGMSVWLLAWAALVIIALNLLVIRHDEPQLGQAYGAEYDDYQARVSRWLPWSWLMQLARGNPPPSGRR